MRTSARALSLLSLLLPSASFARSPAEVACEEAKLGRLIHRLAAGPNLFLWPRGGDRYSGLAAVPRFPVVDGSFVRIDHQLGFDLQLDRAADRLNPRRPLLPRAVLVRNDLLTNPFTPPTADPRIDVTLELAPEVIDPQEPVRGIRINNQTGVPTGSASGASRALEADALFERCPGEGPSELDLQVFEILARTVRVLQLDPESLAFFRYKTAIFPDVEPLTYRLKVYLYDTSCDEECEYFEFPFQVRARMTLDVSRKLAGGRIEALPFCNPSPPPCTNLDAHSRVLVAPPIFAGHETQPPAVYQSGALLKIDYDGSPRNILAADIPWPVLLRGTAWDRPLPAP